MKLKMIFKYAYNRTLKRLLLFFLMVLLCSVMFLLLLTSFFLWGYSNYERYLCNKCLNGGINQCGMLLFESGDIYNPEFISEIYGIEEMVGFTSGDVYNIPIDEIEKFGEQQKKLDLAYFENTGFVQWFYMFQFGTDVCHFELSEGKYPNDWELKDDERLIYLGANFDNVIVGEKFRSKSEPITYVVGGLLKEKTNWIYEDIYRYESAQDSHYVQHLDNMVVCMNPDMISNRNTYCVKKGCEIKDVEEKLMNISEKYGVGIKLARLKDVIEENEYQSSIILNAVRMLTLIIIITSQLVLERTQFSELINDTECMGIFFANGASMRDMTAVLIVENIIKITTAFFIAVVGGYYIVCVRWELFQPGIDYLKTAKSVYFGLAVLPSMIVGLLIVLLSTIKSIKWLKKRNPAELLLDYKI